MTGSLEERFQNLHEFITQARTNRLEPRAKALSRPVSFVFGSELTAGTRNS
jgi:hypothetical protein